MLPVTHGIEYTKTNIVFYTILMVISSLFPYLLGMSGLLYLVSVVVLNLIFIYHVWDLKFGNDVSRPMKTFGFSITYLMCLFIALLVDHYIA
jgi:protoheme IX farnesyltransferase